jgi:hypothetical protein
VSLALQEGVLGPDDEGELIALALAYSFRSAAFELSLQNVADGMDANIKLIDAGVSTELSAPYLFFTRSAFPLLFLAFHDATTREMFQQEPLPEDIQRPQHLYSELSGAARRTDIVNDLRFFRVLHYEL